MWTWAALARGRAEWHRRRRGEISIEEGYFCDYPPAYMLVLGLLGVIGNLLGHGTGSMADFRR